MERAVKVRDRLTHPHRHEDSIVTDADMADFKEAWGLLGLVI